MRNISAVRNTGPTTEADRATLVAGIVERLAIMRAAGERRRVERLLRRSISLTHVHVLTVLRSEGPLTVGALASALDVSVASATGIVTRMEERGLVKRSRDASDRRVVTVSLAAGGQAALDQLQGRGREYFRALLERLTLAELDVVDRGFRAMERAAAELQTSNEEERVNRDG